ncbi:MAG: flagellar basal body P-ring formation protein FlgA [Pontiellaceae bacterium]|nr:flagellar basal body P-ring formation protein FlgA [Pontiellaceae bacterium]
MSRKISILLFAALCLSGTAHAQLLLRMKKTVEVSHRNVMLGDLVDVSSQLPDEWADRKVIAAPASGETSYYALTAIAAALSQYGDMRSVTLSGEPVISILRKDRVVEEEEFHEPIFDYLEETDPWAGKELKINILNVPKNTRVPVGNTTYKITRVDEKTSKGYSIAYATVIVDGIDEKEVPVGLEIQLMAEIWVVAKNLEMGHILEEGDLISEMHVVDSTANNISSRDDMIGFEVNRSLSVGTLLRRSEISKPMCAKRGERVAINAIGENLQITLRGKAMENGRLGERIMCMNERSNRQVLVELTGIGNGVLVRL